MTKITESRTRDILHWLDDRLAEPDLPYQAMALLRDAAALIRQLQSAEQAAWHAGLDAGRDLGRGKERAGAKDAEIETLKAEVAAQRARADAMAGEAIKHEARAELLAEALRLIAAPQRPDGTWNRDREACRQVAEQALRGCEQEVDNG